MTLDVKSAMFYTPAEVAAIFRHEGEPRWCYRHAAPGGFLAPHARRFGRMLLFSKEGIDRMTTLEDQA